MHGGTAARPTCPAAAPVVVGEGARRCPLLSQQLDSGYKSNPPPGLGEKSEKTLQAPKSNGTFHEHSIISSG